MRPALLWGIALGLAVGTQAWLLADGQDQGSPPAANSPAAPAPTTSPARWGPGPYVVRFVMLIIKGPAPIHPPPASPIGDEIRAGSAAAVSPTPAAVSPAPSVIIEYPGQQPGSGAAATDLDVNQMLTTWKRRYPAYQVDVFSVGKVTCKNGQYCTADAKLVKKGDYALNAIDNVKIEQKDGSMTVTRRGSLSLTERSKLYPGDTDSSTSSPGWILDPRPVAPGLLYSDGGMFTHNGEEVLYAYSIIEGGSATK